MEVKPYIEINLKCFTFLYPSVIFLLIKYGYEKSKKEKKGLHLDFTISMFPLDKFTQILQKCVVYKISIHLKFPYVVHLYNSPLSCFIHLYIELARFQILSQAYSSSSPAPLNSLLFSFLLWTNSWSRQLQDLGFCFLQPNQFYYI